jgi:hypothetical protein
VPWWAWALICWASAATVCGLVLGAAAERARARERRWRLHQYVTAPDGARAAGGQPEGAQEIPEQRVARVEAGEAADRRRVSDA